MRRFQTDNFLFLGLIEKRCYVSEICLTNSGNVFLAESAPSKHAIYNPVNICRMIGIFVADN